MERLHGAFSLAIIFAGQPDLMIGARRGSPLAVGYGDGEMYLGSDALALAPLTPAASAISRKTTGSVLSRHGRAHLQRRQAGRAARCAQTALSGALIGKGNYRHFMLKEICEQPAVIGDTLQSFLNPLARRIELPTLPFDLGQGAAADHRRLRHRLSTPAWWRNTGSSRSRACRSRSMSPPSSATAKRRCPKAA